MKQKRFFKIILLSSLIPTAFAVGDNHTVFTYASTAVTSSTVDFNNYQIGQDPAGLKLSYYKDIYSRGFSWQTNQDVDESELYVVKSDLGLNADFSTGFIQGNKETFISGGVTNYTKTAHVDNLLPSTTYSYKVGAPGHYKYGTFKTAPLNNESISILNLTDAQTKDPTLLYKWENTVKQGFDVVKKPDFILYGGDQYDDNMTGVSNKVTRYSGAIDTISNIVGSTPYMATKGNHESNEPNLFRKLNARYYADNSADKIAGYYSFDYDYAHFVVLDTNYINEQQKGWLKNDLTSSNSNEHIKWNIVLMHNGPYCTGDHSNNSTSQKIVTEITPIFSQYHVDLVIQGHDHVYNKTLPYKWDAAGYTTAYNNENVVNLKPETIQIDEKAYDLNPKGTYYVTPGAAGHRVGLAEASDGVWADVNPTDKDNSFLTGKNDSKTFTKNTYKIEVGRVKNGATIGTTTYNAGDPATGNVDGQMFGALHITPNKLSYDFYTVDGASVNLLDSLNVAKMSQEEQILETDDGESLANENLIKGILQKFLTAICNFSKEAIDRLRKLVDSIALALERDRESAIKSDISSVSSTKKVNLQSVQSSIAENNKFNLRLIAAVDNSEINYDTIGFLVQMWNGTSYEEPKDYTNTVVYRQSVEEDEIYGFANSKTVAEFNSGKLFALTIANIPADSYVKFKVTPFAKYGEQTDLGVCFVVELSNGFVQTVQRASFGGIEGGAL